MGLQNVRQRFFARYPVAERFDKALWTQDNQTPSFFVSEVTAHPDLKNVGLALVRLGPRIERRFAISGEVAVFFAPWLDFQRRSYNAMSAQVSKISDDLQKAAFGDVRFSPSLKLVIVVAKDPSVVTKVSDWSQEGGSRTPVVAITEASISGDEAVESLLEAMRQRLGDRDLYRAQNPVVGDDFFGRAGLLRDLETSIRGDENVAIFGLRRSGKTSVIRELKRSMAAQGVIVSITDMQMLEEVPIDQLTTSVMSSLMEDLRQTKQDGQRVHIGTDADVNTPLSLADRVRKVASRNRSLRIVLAVDEVEHLVALAKHDPKSAKAFLGALRSASQAADNVSLLFSGVANTMFLSSALGDGDARQDNPMFGQVAPTFLRPFAEDETEALLNGLGHPMFLHWSDAAVAGVQGWTGGLPFFVRDLASSVAAHVGHKRSLATDVYTVEQSELDEVIEDWRGRAAQLWLETLKALALHYPNAAYLLSPDVDEKSLDQWLSGDDAVQEAAGTLERLGLLVSDSGTLRHSAALVALRALGSPSSIGTGTVSSESTRSLLDLIEGGESQGLEFKQSARVDAKTDLKEKYIEEAIIKTVAGFLNADGGTLLVGVSDEKRLVGIAADLKTVRGGLDGFERWLMADLLGHAIGQALITTRVRISFPELRGLRLARIDVTPSLEEVALVNESDLWVRTGNQTRQLKGREMIEFSRAR